VVNRAKRHLKTGKGSIREYQSNNQKTLRGKSVYIQCCEYRSSTLLFFNINKKIIMTPSP